MSPLGGIESFSHKEPGKRKDVMETTREIGCPSVGLLAVADSSVFHGDYHYCFSFRHFP